MIVPVKITYSGDIFAGKTLAKQAKTQVEILKADMARLGLKQGRRFVPLSSGVTIEARSTFGFDEARISVTPGAGAEIRKGMTQEEILKWYWYAVCVSIEPEPDPITGATIYISGGSSADIDVNQVGDVYVAGLSRTMDFTDMNAEVSSEAVLIKYDQDGKFLGRRVMVGGVLSGANQNESGTGIAIDRTTDPLDVLKGGVYVSAEIYTPRNSATSYDVAVHKYSSTGSSKWRRRLASPSTDNLMLRSWGVESDIAGSAIAWGLINFYDPEFPYDYLYVESFLVKLLYDGTVGFKLQIGDDLRDVDGTPTVTNYALIYDAATNATGDILVSGAIMDQIIGALYPAGLLVKFDTDGTLLWKRALEGRFRQADGLYGWYGTGQFIEACAFDSTGNIFCLSKTRTSTGTNTGYFHYHLSKISADGVLQWQRFIETQYFSDAAAGQSRTQMDIGPGEVYIVFPCHPNPAAVPAVPWGTYIFKFHTDDSTDPLSFKAGDLIWQRLLTLDLPQPQFTSYDGVLTYSIKVVGPDLHLASMVLTGVSPLTIKIPGSGITGSHHGLVFTASALTVYTDEDNIPVRQDAGTGGVTPGYEFLLRSDFSLNVTTGPMEITTPLDGDYVSPVWAQTNKILKSKKLVSKEVS